MSLALEYADPKGKAVFSITNSEDYRQYISVLLSELFVENGEIRKVPYSRDNRTPIGNVGTPGTHHRGTGL